MKEIQEFKQWLSTLGYSHQRVKQYPRYVERMLMHLDRKEVHFTRTELQSYIQHLTTTHAPSGNKLKASFINTQISALRTFARYMEQIHGKNLNVSHLLYLKVPATKPRVLTEQEVQKLYAVTTESIYGLRDRAMLAVCYAGGLRRNEAIHLELKDLDMHRGFVHVRFGKNYKERLVPLPPRAVADIQAYLKRSRPIFGKHIRSSSLFLGYRGAVITAQVFEKRIRKIAQQTEDYTLIGKRVTMHLLRHSIATHLLERGLPLEQVSAFLGHTSLSSTQVYTHILSFKHEQTNFGEIPP